MRPSARQRHPYQDRPVPSRRLRAVCHRRCNRGGSARRRDSLVEVLEAKLPVDSAPPWRPAKPGSSGSRHFGRRCATRRAVGILSRRVHRGLVASPGAWPDPQTRTSPAGVQHWRVRPHQESSGDSTEAWNGPPHTAVSGRFRLMSRRSVRGQVPTGRCPSNGGPSEPIFRPLAADSRRAVRFGLASSSCAHRRTSERLARCGVLASTRCPARPCRGHGCRRSAVRQRRAPVTRYSSQ